MTGAAVVAAVMQAIARLELPVNVVGYLALTENMTGGRAMKMGDVLTMRNGKTVEIMNTDAEGRLILADALAMPSNINPTGCSTWPRSPGPASWRRGSRLPGSSVTTMRSARSSPLPAGRPGRGSGGCRSTTISKSSSRAALRTSKISVESGGRGHGGQVSLAVVGSTPWIHLDIAGPSWCDSENATRDAGGTGCFVRTLVAYVEGWAQLQQRDPENGAVTARVRRESTTRGPTLQPQMPEQPLHRLESGDIKRLADPVAERVAMATAITRIPAGGEARPDGNLRWRPPTSPRPEASSARAGKPRRRLHRGDVFLADDLCRRHSLRPAASRTTWMFRAMCRRRPPIWPGLPAGSARPTRDRVGENS